MVARHDLVTDEEVRAGLLTARRGTAFFARKLGKLSYADMDEPSLLPGWNRRQLIAHVGCNARAVARLVEWAATGVETPMYPDMEYRNREIEFGATLPPIALLNLFDHSAVHLSVEWRDLPDEKWAAEVRTAQGRTVPVSETVWMRTREVWPHAIDLDNGARFTDVPTDVLRRLLTDITGVWATRGNAVALTVTGGPHDGERVGASEDDATEVSGSLPDLVRWASGRVPAGEASGVVFADGSAAPAAPAWI
ncbi:maleylpyruvate isomerase family mycothiol-dependent enzyme [Tersicoccus sp. Bi-70]|uniref:maleylpyruvate isomerase family mycothiol-dependent enzyme n=1 Tax=Tersicoccus sp. Bi-70 TaxID=1897634 RepID=UPI000975C04E|nr:maleylpyruvate isomerase family mycothiol-dependent enzyme [Tersicoccus sp. Bi-70]OMH32339.1 maleylpyruvate isomerase [Tersicoccus sp. Bi-70]